ncbi:putative extracellular solute-binding protein [Actinomycetales bacterium JB111]|nr:putative extracellular solute-binding protein [Actinomycetales bacterium JB111]
MTHYRNCGAIVVAAALALTSCSSNDTGSDSPPEAGSDSDHDLETTELSIGSLGLADEVPLYIAIDEGFFDDEGLSVEAHTAPGGGAALTAALMSGETQFAYTAYVSIFLASAQGLPIRVARENDGAGPQGIYAAAGSGITTPSDLAGRSIAVNSLSNFQEVTARAALDHAGVDSTTVEFVEIPPPEMQAAVETGNVDAAWLPEPFLTIATGDGTLTEILPVFTGPIEDLPVAGWATTESFAAENPLTTAAFVRAIDRAIEFAYDNPERRDEIIADYSGMDLSLVQELEPPNLIADPTRDLAPVVDLMVNYGLLDTEINANDVLLDEASA